MQFQRRSIFSCFSLSSIFSFCHCLHLIIMSISFHLICFLLCISLEACHPRSLHLVDNKSQKKLQDPIKGRLEKVVLSWDKRAIECRKLSPSKAAEEKETVESKRQKHKRRMKHLRRLGELKEASWRVPDDDNQKKVKGNNGVFSSDYEHARTHPPSHN